MSWLSFCFIKKAVTAAVSLALQVRCSHNTFDSADGLINQSFLDSAEFESGTFRKAAYKHDNAACWRQWVDEIGLDFAQLTGPKAHGFRIALRQQLKPEDIAEARQTSFANAPRFGTPPVYERPVPSLYACPCQRDEERSGVSELAACW